MLRNRQLGWRLFDSRTLVATLVSLTLGLAPAALASGEKRGQSADGECPAGFDIESGQMRVDLSTYRERTLLDLVTNSHVVTSRRVELTVAVNSDDLTEIRFSHSTEGDSIRERKLADGLIFNETEQCGAPRPNTMRYAIYRIPGIGPLIVRKCLRRYEVAVPPKVVQSGYFWYELEYLDGFQDPSHQWAGYKFPAHAQEFKIAITFPEKKRLKKPYFRVGRASDRYSFREVENPESKAAPDGRSLEWTLRDVPCGSAADVEWEW